MNIDAVEKGFYEVIVDDVVVSKHSKPNKAVLRACEEQIANPDSKVYVKQPNIEPVVSGFDEPITDPDPIDEPDDPIVIPPTNDGVFAFPSAYGGGAYATGGRGGNVYVVTNLNDTGDGSFRWALGQPRPANIVFNVSGTINIKSWLDIGGKDLTVAGQTAPIGGITIASTNGSRFRFRGDCENIIMRYIRVRPANKSNDDAWELYSSNYMRNIILDHCSISYGGDECISIRGAGANNITFQRMSIAEAKTGSLFGDSNNPSYSYDNTFINSLFFNVSHRHPNASSNGRVDVINNVVQQHQYRLAGANGNIKLNHINNYYALGLKSSLEGGGSQKNLNVYFGGNPQIYTAGNIADKGQFTDTKADNRVLWVNSEGGQQTTYAPSSIFTDTPYELVGRPFEIKTAFDAYQDVIQDVGANASLNANGTVSYYTDTQDTFYLDKMKGGEGSGHAYKMNGNYPQPGSNRTWWEEDMYLNFVSSVSNTPINVRPSDFDTNGDGIPDVWSDAVIPSGKTYKDIAPNGYTYFENYINSVDE